MAEKDRRPYFKVTQDYFTSPKIMGISNDAKVLHLSLIAYSAIYKTDGVVPARMCQIEGAEALKELTASRMLVKRGKDYEIRHYLMHQTPAQEISTKATKGAHVRWHEGKNKVEPGCVYCQDAQLNEGPWEPNTGEEAPF